MADRSHSYHKRSSCLLPSHWLPEAANDVSQVKRACKRCSLPGDVAACWVGALLCGECDAIMTGALPAAPCDEAISPPPAWPSTPPPPFHTVGQRVQLGFKII